jgi:hypothetical protein
MAWELIGNGGSNPSVDFLGTTDNQPLVVKTNMVEHLRIDTAGNIGIGTDSVLDKLHIYSGSGSANVRVEANNGAGGFRSYSFGTSTSDFNLHLRDETGGYDVLQALWWNGNIILGGTASSHVGIGVGDPLDKLHIYSGSGSANVRVEANNGAGGFRSYSFGTSTSDFNLHLRDETGGHDVVTVSWTNGYVGIGTTAPSERLTVAGNVVVTGDVKLTGSDCAEDFDVVDSSGLEPGNVLVLDNSGALRMSESAYDTRVAGVVSGAGSYRPGVVLDRQDEASGRVPVALMGKVFCKVDANFGSVAAGDLLTTSSTAGHAMKAADRTRAQGSIVGKALAPLPEGQDIVPILVSLQ